MPPISILQHICKERNEKFNIILGLTLISWGTNSLLDAGIAINIMQGLLGAITIYYVIKEMRARNEHHR